MSPKPTLLFVHGAWHTPECFEKIISPLESNGFKCIAPQMEFAGHESPVKSIGLDVELLRNIIRSEIALGNDVVLVVHSFGGVVGFSAVEGFPRKRHDLVENSTPQAAVIGAVGLACFLNATGMPAVARKGGAPPWWDVNSETGWVGVKGDPAERFYQELPQEEAKRYVGLLRMQSMDSLFNGEDVYAGYLDVPVWYLSCTEDRAIGIAAQEGWLAQAKEAGANITVRKIACGHSPFLVRPGETVQFIIDAVSAFRGA